MAAEDVAFWMDMAHALGVHNWTRWETYAVQCLQYPSIADREAGRTEAFQITETRQARRCLTCGKETHRRVPYGAGSSYDGEMKKKTTAQ